MAILDSSPFNYFLFTVCVDCCSFINCEFCERRISKEGSVSFDWWIILFNSRSNLILAYFTTFGSLYQTDFTETYNSVSEIII